MPVPKRKKSKSAKGMRRSQHDKLTLPHVHVCNNCGGDVLSHRVCPRCGWYKGAVAIEMPSPVEEIAAEE